MSSRLSASDRAFPAAPLLTDQNFPIILAESFPLSWSFFCQSLGQWGPVQLSAGRLEPPPPPPNPHQVPPAPFFHPAPFPSWLAWRSFGNSVSLVLFRKQPLMGFSKAIFQQFLRGNSNGGWWWYTFFYGSVALVA